MDYTELKKLMSEQKVEMTAAERIKAYNEGKEVDHIPYTLQAPDPAMADIFGFTTSQFAKDFEVKSEVIRRRNILIILNIMCCRIMRISTNWK